MLNGLIENMLDTFPVFSRQTCAEARAAWKTALTQAKPVGETTRGKQIHYRRGEIGFYGPTSDFEFEWSVTTLEELERMLMLRELDIHPYDLEDLATHMRRERAYDFTVSCTFDKVVYPVFRLDPRMRRFAMRGGLRRKYPSLYTEEDPKEPQLGDLIIDGAIYAPSTAGYDFLPFD